MLKKETKVLMDLDVEINILADAVKKLKHSNEIMKLIIQKKELMLKKIELDQE